MKGTDATRFWRNWVVATALVYGAAWVLLSAADTAPRPAPLLLLVAVATAVLALVNLNLTSEVPDWEVHASYPVTPPGQDARLAMFARVVGGHIDARHADDPGLRDRLASLAADRLRQRHGLGLSDPAAADLLGAEATGILTGPPRALRRPEIENCVRRIEEL
jgi:hypothetical protein